MNTKTFNENYEIDRKSKGVKAMPKHARAAPLVIQTADGVAYDANQTYYFFDEQTRAVRQSTGLRRDGGYLCTFGLRVIPVFKLRASRSDALDDGQKFLNLEIEKLQKQIIDYEAEKGD